MNDPAAKPEFGPSPGNPIFSKLSPVWILVLSLLLLPFQVNNQSLWIDEGDTAAYALQPTFHSWFDRLTHDPRADCQMPLPMWIAWLGGQTLGLKEWELRAVNLLWACGSLVLMFFAGRVLGCKWLPALLAIQPYFWFYTNEARPYAFEIFCGTLLLLGTAVFLRDQASGQRWAWLMAAGAVLLGYATLLAPFPLIAVCVVCGLTAYRGKWRITRPAWLPLVAGGVLLLVAGAYYAWTIWRGTEFRVPWQRDWKASFYSFYEFTGLSGLGPSLLETREAAQAGRLPALLHGHRMEFALVALAAGSWALLLGWGIRKLARERDWRWFALFMAVPLIGGGLLTITGLCVRKMIWTRHWAPMFPFYIAAFALALKEARNKSPAPHRVLTGIWVLLMMASAFSFRFAAKHQKDDYRAAAALAKHYLQEGNPVLWAASWHCATYYGLPVGTNDVPAKTALALSYSIQPNPPPAASAPIQLPVVFLSRPNAFDPDGTIRSYAASNNMTRLENPCHAFSIYLPTPGLTPLTPDGVN